MADSIKYKAIPDWPHLRERYTAYLDQRVLDQGIIAHIQNPAEQRPLPEPWMLEESEQKYLNPQKLFDLKCWRRTAWNWHADLFKYMTPVYGPNVFTGFCGGRPAFGRDTVWHDPVIKGLDEADKIHFDESNPYWRIQLEIADYFAQRCKGLAHISTVDFGGPTDWISQLMGTEAFLIATIDDPDKMRALAIRLARECNQAFDRVYPLVSRYNDGIVNWMPVWYPGRMGTLQDDMAINFSPALYADVFLPALTIMAEHTDYTILHWHDGCRQHLDALLQVAAIDLIQFGHDPSSPAFRELIPEMRKIQAAGKLLFISCVEAEDVAYFIRHLDPRGLMMIINTADDKASHDMAEKIIPWTSQRLAELGS